MENAKKPESIRQITSLIDDPVLSQFIQNVVQKGWIWISVCTSFENKSLIYCNTFNIINLKPKINVRVGELFFVLSNDIYFTQNRGLS